MYFTPLIKSLHPYLCSYTGLRKPVKRVRGHPVSVVVTIGLNPDILGLMVIYRVETKRYLHIYMTLFKRYSLFDVIFSVINYVL